MTTAHPHAEAMSHLSRADPRMAALIARVGPCRLALNVTSASGHDEMLGSLIHAIVAQQLSPKAADTIFSRVRALASATLGAESMLALPEDKLRGAGLSAAKTRSVRDLCEHVAR